MEEMFRILREDERLDDVSMEDIKGGFTNYSLAAGDCDDKCCGLNFGCHERECSKDDDPIILPSCPADVHLPLR